MTADFNSASNFEMSRYLNEQGTYNTRSYTAEEIAKANMEAEDIQRAEEAVKAEEHQFGSLTLGQKFKDLGIGEHVLNLVLDSIKNVAKSATSWDKVEEYLEKYENIYDLDAYNAELQAYGKQHFFSNRALSEEAAKNPVGTKFTYQM